MPSQKEDAKRTNLAVVELRQYSLVPGKRDVLIDLFEANFIESQEACGITVIGTFRDLDDDTRFVWLRGFAIREGEHVIVWLTGYRDQATYDRVHATGADVGRIAARTPELIASPHILRLAPTRRSRLTGDPDSAAPSRESSATER
jgi:hypothetical protein